jgi:hypothetical protein
MLEITERSVRKCFPTLDQASRTASSYRQALRSIRSKQTRAIWLLSILGLIPVAELVLFPEKWHELPHGVQWAGYLASLILLSAACALIVNPGDEHTPGCKPDSAESRKRRKHRRLGVTLSREDSVHGA